MAYNVVMASSNILLMQVMVICHQNVIISSYHTDLLVNKPVFFLSGVVVNFGVVHCFDRWVSGKLVTLKTGKCHVRKEFLYHKLHLKFVTTSSLPTAKCLCKGSIGVSPDVERVPSTCILR